MNLNKKLFIVGIIGSVLCFAGDMLLGCFTPSKEFGNSIIFPPFSDDWANSSPYRFVIGGLFEVIALLLMFYGFYAIYREMIAKKCKYSKLFIICAFVSVGTLYHCVFAMTAYIYNRLYNLQILESKLIAEQLFFAFIAVASLAAVAFAGLSVYLFFVTITGKFNNEKWLSIFIDNVGVISDMFYPQQSWVTVQGQTSDLGTLYCKKRKNRSITSNLLGNFAFCEIPRFSLKAVPLGCRPKSLGGIPLFLTEF